MPVLSEILSKDVGGKLKHIGDAAELIERQTSKAAVSLTKRINIPIHQHSPQGLIDANTIDPWSQSGKYALGFVYFGLIIFVGAAVLRGYHLFGDLIRTAYHKEEVAQSSTTSSPSTEYELSVLSTDKSTAKFFPRTGPLLQETKKESTVSSIGPINNTIAFFRYIFYRPLPAIKLRKRWHPIVLPSLAVAVIVSAALAFTVLYSFVPQPLFWASIRYGSPPLAIRSGMLAVALVPWIIALSMKANIISMLTGIGHERLNVLHRFGGYLCLILSIIHTVPFYITPVWDQGGLRIFKSYFPQGDFYIYGTGIAALVPLGFLCIHSLPFLRRKMYELFVVLHVPASIVFFAMLFWHCNNYLTSWNYLFSTLAIWLSSYVMRLFYLNWAKPFRMSWLIGDEAAVTLLPENAIKVTIPTETKWRPGQYIYLRMPGISAFENHPFTIASLCSDDFPSEYGVNHRDMVVVFRPFGGFTSKVLQSAYENGPWHSYRAFIDGPYGGMQRRLESFDHVVLIAGGSGITAIVSQLLDLIKRMREGKALTKKVQVIWALKRPETMEWFKEELRICRESAPPESVECQFYITTAKRQPKTGQLVSAQTPTRPMSTFFHDKVDSAFQGIANKRLSHDMSMKRSSALIREEAGGDPEREKELREENEDAITALPQAHVLPMRTPSTRSTPTLNTSPHFSTPHLSPPSPRLPMPQPTGTSPIQEKRSAFRNLSLDISSAVKAGNTAIDPTVADQPQQFDFGFPSTPTEFQKNLMRFAFLPAAVKKRDGWSTEYGRPDVPYMLKEFSREFGKRTCVFVCGPPSMRIDVSRTVAELQKDVWSDPDKDELFLHTENYAI